VEPDGRRRDEVLADIDRLERERDSLTDVEQSPGESVPAEEALDYLNDLGRLWRETTDEGRKALATAVFSRLGAAQVGHRTLHDPRRPAQGRIVSVAVTDYAERRGLVLALPTRLEVVVVGDTGLEPVTSCMSNITGLAQYRRAWEG
jgi:hypothetical protein